MVSSAYLYLYSLTLRQAGPKRSKTPNFLGSANYRYSCNMQPGAGIFAALVGVFAVGQLDGCEPDFGDPCGYALGLFYNTECMYGSSTAPSYCAIANGSTGVWSGTCTAPPASVRSDIIFGTPCAMADRMSPLSCQSFDPWAAVRTSNAARPAIVNGGIAGALSCVNTSSSADGTCGFAGARFVGDPCVLRVGCGSSSLRCDTGSDAGGATGVCVPAHGTGMTPCSSDADCASDWFCPPPPLLPPTSPRECARSLPVGAACTWNGTAAANRPRTPLPSTTGNPCGRGAVCFAIDSPLGLTPQGAGGICTPLASLPAGAAFTIAIAAVTGTPFAEAVRVGALLCASGYGVLVADPATGLSGTAAACADGPWDWTGAGQACTGCVSDPAGPRQRLVPGSGGALACIPTGSGGAVPCTQVPLTPYSIGAPAARAALLRCIATASAPAAAGGGPCAAYAAGTSGGLPPLNTASCAYYACYGAWAAEVAAVVHRNAWYPPALPGTTGHPPPTACELSRLELALSYAIAPGGIGGNGAAPVGCALPPEFAAAGWACNATGLPAAPLPPIGSAPWVSTAVVAGVAISCIVAALVTAIVVLWCCRRCRSRGANKGVSRPATRRDSAFDEGAALTGAAALPHVAPSLGEQRSAGEQCPAAVPRVAFEMTRV